MNTITTLWSRLDRAGRLSLAAGAAAIVIGGGIAAVWLAHDPYEVLFADLSPRDSAAIAAELDRLKTPYQVDEATQALRVPRDEVARTRLKLMSGDLALQGTVGFELFNQSDLGMTEFVQKVNYQRALQGELTRTILSMDGVQTARVHLALPEQGLFRKAQGNEAKASVTLGLAPGRRLSAAQIGGIQRLVAASVPEVQPATVTVLDQHGEPLSRNGEADDAAGEGADPAVLALKRSTEDYLTRKLSGVLDRALGAGEAIATVDVVLDMDRTRITTEEVLPAPGGSSDAAPAGVVVKESQTLRDAPLGEAADGKATVAPTVQHNEVSYQTGRRTAQQVVAPGALKALSVAVIVKRPLDDARRERLKEVVAVAVGLKPNRGDSIAVRTVSEVADIAEAAAGQASEASAHARSGRGDAAIRGALSPDAERAGQAVGNPRGVAASTVVIAVLAALLVLTLVIGLSFRARRRSGADAPGERRPDREEVLRAVRAWLDDPVTPPARE